jgi:hypothetical protein
MIANGFEVGDEVTGRVGGPGKIRVAAAGAALIHQEDVIARRIKQHPMQMLRAAARTAVEKGDRPAALATDFLDIDPMPVSDVQHAGIEWTECFGELLHRPSAEHGMRRRASNAAP